MVQVIRAIVQDGALWPLEPLRAESGAWVHLVVRRPEAEPESPLEERVRLLDELSSLFAWDPLDSRGGPPTLEW